MKKLSRDIIFIGSALVVFSACGKGGIQGTYTGTEQLIMGQSSGFQSACNSDTVSIQISNSSQTASGTWTSTSTCNSQAQVAGGYPGYPSQGGYPGYPTQGGYPGYPTQGGYPGQSGYPTQTQPPTNAPVVYQGPIYGQVADNTINIQNLILVAQGTNTQNNQFGGFGQSGTPQQCGPYSGQLTIANNQLGGTLTLTPTNQGVGSNGCPQSRQILQAGLSN